MQDTQTVSSASTINQDSLETQIDRLLHHLQTGNTINFTVAMKMGTGNLHSRIPELKTAGIPIYSRFIKVGRIDCKEYSLQTFVQFSHQAILQTENDVKKLHRKIK